jgi:hypothetical protein
LQSKAATIKAGDLIEVKIKNKIKIKNKNFKLKEKIGLSLLDA